MRELWILKSHELSFDIFPDNQTDTFHLGWLVFIRSKSKTWEEDDQFYLGEFQLN